jgi:hypothetical protein
MLDTAREVAKPPFQIVQDVVDRKWTFAIHHFPTEQQSDEEPPFRLGVKADTIPIDELLGRYEPDYQKITIFRRGIKEVAQRLSLGELDITRIVRLHEWAHALIHIGLSQGERLRVTGDEMLWPGLLALGTATFHRLDRGLHERLAQLIVYHGLQSQRSDAIVPEAQQALDRILAAFDMLAQHAPNDYRIERYTSVPRNRIVTSIGLLKDGGLVGFAAWDTVIRW